MGRSPCCAKEGLNRGAWTSMEDKILTEYIKIQGEGKWRHLPKRAGLKRCGKSCRLRWLNYLRPDIKRGNITHDEEELIIRLHKLLGNRWSLIAGRLPGRTDNEIKNYWNTNIGKKLQNGNPVFSANPAQQHPNPKNETQKQDPNPVNLGSCIVRTKAKRCTKVVITKEPQQLIRSMPKSSITCDNVNDDKTLMGSGSGSGSGSDSLSWQAPFVPEGSNPLDFLADFEMDGNFLSDLLKTDFSESFCFETNVEDSNASTSENNVIGGQLSPRSNETCLYSDDALHGKEFQSMSTLAESEFDWL